MPDVHIGGAESYGYLLVHFVEDHSGHGERIFFTLSDGDTPLRWRRANRGEPVLASKLGTTGVRDPYLVRGSGEFYLLATDLRVFGGDGAGWDAWTRHGSRSIVVWRSVDLVSWSEPWLAEVAPPTAGMAWAPEATFDAATGQYDVYWSSTLYSGPDHTEASYSRVLISRTTDFRQFSRPAPLIDRGVSVIDTTMTSHAGRVHRFSKEESQTLNSKGVFHEVGSSIYADDFEVLATRIAGDRGAVEAPLIFRDHATARWYLWVDQYSNGRQGYLAYYADDLESGMWTAVEDTDFTLAANTKHGVVVPLDGDEWARLRVAYPAGKV